MIEALDLQVRCSGHTLLDRVSLRVERGKMLALAGPNGAGKSTLLRALAGDLSIARGTVRLAGRPLDAWSLQEQACRRAVLTQHVPLSFPFTAFEVVMMGRSPRSSPQTRVSDHAIAFAAMRLVDTENLAGRSYPTLSGGERQRVQLARVLAQVWETPDDGSPRFLLLDEPTSSLDLAQQHRVLEALIKVARRDVGVLIVLHDLNLAARYADSIALLRDGGVVAVGPPAVVLNPSTVAQTFGVRTVFLQHSGSSYAVVVSDSSDAPQPQTLP